MSRTDRLFELIQILRRHRYPVRGANLAEELGVSLRTLYRDIATLQAQGASIDGEPGLGYVLRPGFMLPPLMFSEDEIEALVLGSRWVAKRTDSQLSSAAKNALAKIAAVLPDDLRHQLDASGLLVGPANTLSAGDEELATIRKVIRGECKLLISYKDSSEQLSERIIWPFALGFFEQVRIVIAWCELRQEFRHFRTDRIIKITRLDIRYPARRQTLLKKWREQQGIPVQ
ncbi:transcription regulator protein, DeoR family [Legionella moravica]|uniref:Transcription regulator protein, DeoR family n=1 Tax=Legionella moravica TaxID=39962 RepID=A0A378K174_9GAMM|nr:YafY family protein [Legionella moravica]KTD37519.1 transcription regulator protein, DeoR family [Legionella moravica]STX61581.1 transcription regulator protein, DeoR family [Legionella moravica]